MEICSKIKKQFITLQEWFKYNELEKLFQFEQFIRNEEGLIMQYKENQKQIEILQDNLNNQHKISAMESTYESGDINYNLM